MSSEAILRHAVKGALALGSAGSLVGAGVALAQTAPASGTAQGATKLSQIVVTGSHIPRTAVAKAQPVISINRQAIDNTGYTNVGQLLQNLSSAGPSLNLNINNGNTAGLQTVDIHQLGSQRVLVLVNGQRWVPTVGGSVDLSTIPLSIVQRVDVLLDGASAVYGSDAIAGVINIITIKNYNGAEAHATFGMYDGHGVGGGWDGKTQKYSFTVGSTTDRSSVLMSAGYYNRDPIWAGQRTISKEPYIDFGTHYGSSGTPGGRIFIWGANNGNSVGGTACPTGASFCDLSGPSAANMSPGFHSWTAADYYNYAPANYLLQPQEHWYTYTQGHYDLTDNVTFNFTGAYQKRDSQAILAPSPWFLGFLFGGSSTQQNGMFIGMASNNPGNPFGVDLVPYFPSSAGFSSWCQKYGSPTCSSQYDILGLYGRRPFETGNRVFTQNVATYYFNGGFNGYFQVGNNEWNWNANYIFSKRMNTAITTGLTNTARLQEAMSYNCGGASDPNCVPLNVMGGAFANGGTGSMTTNMVNYITFTAHRVNSITMRDYNAGINGNFFNSWYAGPWGFATGYEYEALDGYNQPDALTSLGNTTGSVIQPTGGRQNTNAQYVELSVPLAHDVFLAKDIGIDVAQRWSQFHWSGIGSSFNTQTGAIGTKTANARAHSATPRATFKWQPVQSLLIRGTWAQGFRIPSISELFLGASQNFPTVTDPCSTAGVGPYNPVTNPNGARNCPNIGTPIIQPNGQIGSTVGGNANLQPEKATTRTVGFVWSPTFLEGFDFSADYFHTEVTNQVSVLGASNLLQLCNGPKAQPSPNPYCQFVLRNGTTGQITNIVDLNRNGGSTKVSGWDLNARYHLPTTPIGDFTVSATANFIQQDIFCDAVGNCQQTAGTTTASAFFGTPKHKYKLSVDWNYGAWGATYQMRVVGPMWENCATAPINGFSYASSSSTTGTLADLSWCSKIIHTGTDAYGDTIVTDGQNHLGTTVYSDIQASYTVASWNTTFSFGINNLFNKQPPISRTSFENSYVPNFYDVPGRYFYGRISVRF